MARTATIPTQAARVSYVLMLVFFILVGWLHLATLTLTTFFGYFALRQFTFRRSKALAVGLYLILVTLLSYGLFFFSRQAYETLPKLANVTIPAIVEFAEQQEVQLPFSDLKSLKQLALQEVKERSANIGKYARGTVSEVAALVVGLVVALGIFLNARPNLDLDAETARDSLYFAISRELVLRFRTFYRSFATVIGAQIVISLINTALTSMFLLWNGYPYATVIIVLTFLLGLLPILGNLISNTLIIGVGFTLSPRIALMALIYLVVIHKLEYFLNSKIIGDRIKNPMWLTLIGLVVGERLMGVPGMILAPVVLHYLKVEGSRAKFRETVDAAGTRPGPLPEPVTDGQDPP